MKKYIKLYSTLLIALILLIISITSPMAAFNDVNIILDSNNITTLPINLRTTSDISNITKIKSLNLSGLDKLNISGSGQFTEFNLPTIIKSLDTNGSIIDIDLREESHGFINGIAISFKNDDNNANKGLNITEVIDKEIKDLSSIKLDSPLNLYNSDVVLTPQIVENEDTLVKSMNLEYLRIPVTDGGLPTEEMVSYFIDFVKNQPENSWLHFHCKAGVGRTTTFMIMYDIIKNCNDVSLNDIIGRQLLLGDIGKTNYVDFYIGNRYKFLSNFYNNCKEDKFNISSLDDSSNISTCLSNIIKRNFSNPSTDSNLIIEDSYIKNILPPKFLYVISENDMTTAERTMIATLQGLIASKSTNQIYILSPTEPDYEIWLEDLHNSYDVKSEVICNPWLLIEEFKEFINGYVLYSTVKAPSINNACTLSSLKDSIAIDESIEENIKNYGINNQVYDCRNTDNHWAFDTLWDSGLNHSTVIELSSDKSIPLRDYAILSKSLIFYEDDIKDTTFKDSILSSMDDGGRILGWGPDEHTNVEICSKYGVTVIPADWSYNLSVLSSFKTICQCGNIPTNEINEDGFHYVTFIMSDGDNQQWLLGSNFNNKNWFGSPYRGSFNLGWSLSPSLYYLAPTVFNKYYEAAKETDNFVVSASGKGYMYPSKYPLEKLDDYTKSLSEYMYKVDQHNVLILDDEAFYKKEVWDKYTSNTNIDSLLYLNYNINNAYDGKIIWSNDKPIISCRDLLWGGLEDQNTLISNIIERVNAGYTDIKNPNSYTFVYVHVWSNTMDNVNAVVSKLSKYNNVKIVSPNTFVKLIKDNVSHVDF